MAKQTKAQARAARRREDAAFTFLATGVVFVIAPLAFRTSPLGKGLAWIIPIGLLVLALGALLLFFGRSNKRKRTALPASHGEYVPTLLTRLEVSEEDLVPAQFERESEVKEPRTARPPRPAGWGPDVFRAIEWRRFEAVVEAMFRQAGMQTKSQPHGADGGVDIWLFAAQHPETAVGLVQCKHWTSKPVGVDKIRELRGVMAAKKVGRGIFATTSRFTNDATQFGRDNGIDLLDVERLLAMIAKRSAPEQRALLDVALEGEYWRPTCAKCGAKMVERAPRQGGDAFWGCSNFPRCRSILSTAAA